MAFDFEIKKQLGTFRERGDFRHEVNLVSWNGKEARVDIRKWQVTEDERKALKGISMTREEAVVLREILEQVKIE